MCQTRAGPKQCLEKAETGPATTDFCLVGTGHGLGWEMGVVGCIHKFTMSSACAFNTELQRFHEGIPHNPSLWVQRSLF